MVSLGDYCRPGTPDLLVLNLIVLLGGILLEGHFKGFDGVIKLLNVYGPYKDRQSFWDNIYKLGLLNLENLILGGDLNFTLGPSEVWGGRQADDPLWYYLADLFQSVELVDVIADFSSPT